MQARAATLVLLASCCAALSIFDLLGELDIATQVQPEVPDSLQFPCPNMALFRSPKPPSSVHQLMPGDVDVVAAIGDSLSAGVGALAKNLYEVMVLQNRGVAWSAGGQDSWRRFLTVPNILKLYNANLTGFSVGDGAADSPRARLNVAFNGAMDQDMEEMARKLIRRMRADPTVDFKNHWKLITLWIGTNDLCSDYCYDRENQGAKAHAQNLQRALDVLYAEVPRAFVNLISAPYVAAYAAMRDQASMCLTTVPFFCSCMLGGDESTKLKDVVRTTRDFQRVENKLVQSPRYQGREDFTVVLQPTFRNFRLPTRRDASTNRNTTDFSYLASDCFHFSQKMQAAAANLLWNNMLEAPGEKTSKLRPAFQSVTCPTSQRPYLATNRNSKL